MKNYDFLIPLTLLIFMALIAANSVKDKWIEAEHFVIFSTLLLYFQGERNAKKNKTTEETGRIVPFSSKDKNT